jgi:hypothetical protein
LALTAPFLSPLPVVDVPEPLLVGAAGEALLPPPQPLIQTVMPTKIALMDAALNSRLVNRCSMLLPAMLHLLKAVSWPVRAAHARRPSRDMEPVLDPALTPVEDAPGWSPQASACVSRSERHQPT